MTNTSAPGSEEGSESLSTPQESSTHTSDPSQTYSDTRSIENQPYRKKDWQHYLTKYVDFSSLLNGLAQRGHIDHTVFPLTSASPHPYEPALLQELQAVAAKSVESAEQVFGTKLNEMLQNIQPHFSSLPLRYQICFEEAEELLPHTDICTTICEHDFIIRDPAEPRTWLTSYAFGELTTEPIHNVSRSISASVTHAEHSIPTPAQLDDKHLQLLNNMNAGLLHRPLSSHFFGFGFSQNENNGRKTTTYIFACLTREDLMFCEIEDCFGTEDKLYQVLQSLYFLCAAKDEDLHGFNQCNLRHFMHFKCDLPTSEPDRPDMKDKWTSQSSLDSLDGFPEGLPRFSGHRRFGPASAVYFNGSDAYKAVWLPEILSKEGNHVMAKELEVMQVLHQHLPAEFKNRIPELRGWAHEKRQNAETVDPGQRNPGVDIPKRHLWIIRMSRGGLIEPAVVRNLSDFAELLKDIAATINEFHLIGVVHRDISRNNILCQRTSESGNPVKSFIIDFDNASYVDRDTGYRNSNDMQIGRKAPILLTLDCVPYALLVGGLTCLYRFHVRQEMESILYLFTHILMRLFFPSEQEAKHDRQVASAQKPASDRYEPRASQTQNASIASSPAPVSQRGYELQTGQHCDKNFGKCRQALLDLADRELRDLLRASVEEWEELPIVPNKKEREFWTAWSAQALKQERKLRQDKSTPGLEGLSLQTLREVLEKSMPAGQRDLVSIQDSAYFRNRFDLNSLLNTFAEKIANWSDRIPAELGKDD